MKFPSAGRTAEGGKPLIDPERAKRLISDGKIDDPETEIKQISMKISAELLTRCDAACRQASVTRSAFIKMAILEKLERAGK